jgi:hypothetical protein
MTSEKYGLTHAEYMAFRNRYLPNPVKTIFVLESPPKTGLYFYNPDGKTGEPLFTAMMKDVLEIKPRTKDAGLREFAARGYLLIDATYSPVDHLKGRKRDDAILANLSKLLDDLRRYVTPETQVIIAKANVCDLLDVRLTAAGINVINRGERIYFPSHSRQPQFREAVRRLLAIGA